MKAITAIRAFGCDRNGNLIEERQDFDTVKEAHAFVAGAPIQTIRMNYAVAISDVSGLFAADPAP